MPAVLGAEGVDEDTASALPLSDGVMERATEAGRGLASGEAIRGAAETRGWGATGGLGAGAAGAGADHGSESRRISF